VNINEAVMEIVELTRGETTKNAISVEIRLAESLPPAQGDRVQLQQVILNLLINAIEAMGAIREGPRRLLIGTRKTESESVLLEVRDSGPGLAPESVDRLFQSFYTTKPDGLGMGLSICRSTIEPVFQFTLPA
jgi:C4-dicarboxylate-specific signal transduction histidine kinase